MRALLAQHGVCGPSGGATIGAASLWDSAGSLSRRSGGRVAVPPASSTSHAANGCPTSLHTCPHLSTLSLTLPTSLHTCSHLSTPAHISPHPPTSLYPLCHPHCQAFYRLLATAAWCAAKACVWWHHRGLTVSASRAILQSVRGHSISLFKWCDSCLLGVAVGHLRNQYSTLSPMQHSRQPSRHCLSQHSSPNREAH